MNEITMSVSRIPVVGSKKEMKSAIAYIASGNFEEKKAGFDQIQQLILSSFWSSATYHGSRKIKQNFKSSSLIVLDFDKGHLTLEDAIEKFNQYKCIIGTTQSHSESLHRYRVVLFLESEVTDLKQYEKILNYMIRNSPECDKQCSDASRLWFPCLNIVYANEHGAELSPDVLTERSERPQIVVGDMAKNITIERFKTVGAPQGEFNTTLFKVAFEYKRLGLTQEFCISDLNIALRRLKNTNPDFHELDSTDLRTIQSAFDREIPWTIDNMYTAFRLEEIANSTDFFNKFVQLSGLHVDENDVLIIPGVMQKQREELFKSCYKVYWNAFCFLKNKSQNKITELKQSVLKTEFDSFYEREMEKRRQLFKESIAYDPSASAVELEWLMNVYFKQDENLELSKKNFKHWLWQIKRKVFGKEVYNARMLILSGPPRGGKTRLMDLIVNVFKRYATQKRVDSFLDERALATTSERNYIVFFDEVRGLSGDTIRTFKDLIDNRFNVFRPMGSNYEETLRNNASFIGCTNEDMSDLLKDPTGYRKFYEIKINGKEKTKDHWEEVNKLDIKKLFKCIDENEESGFLAEADLDMQKAIQAQDMWQGSVKYWLDDKAIEFCPKGEGVKCSLNDLYQDYKLSCERDSIRGLILTKPAFKKDLMKRGVEFYRSGKIKDWGCDLKEEIEGQDL